MASVSQVPSLQGVEMSVAGTSVTVALGVSLTGHGVPGHLTEHYSGSAFDVILAVTGI